MSRRLFLRSGGSAFQIFSFNQHADGSIYVSLPEFENAIWMTLVSHEGRPALARVDPLGQDGKLSIHGSGMATYRAHKDLKGHKLIVKGSYLLDAKQERIGVRHLLTAKFQQPSFEPIASPAGNRQSDVVIQLQDLKPYIISFFAIPLQKLTVNFSASFHADDLETIPPESGWGTFELRQHLVIWFCYRTKHMARWTANTHVAYSDGYLVPFFIGTGEGEARIEFRVPKYTFNNGQLLIELPMDESCGSTES